MNNLMAEMRVLWQTQRQKVVSLGVLLAVLGLMFGKNLISSNARTARAESARAASAADADAPAPSPEQASRATIRVPEPPPITRDVFAYNRNHFPLPPSEEAEQPIAHKSPGGPAEINSDGAEPTREQIEAAVNAEAASLVLRSLVVGATPLAVIEIEKGPDRGRHVMAPGEELVGFRLEQVRQDSVVIQKDGVHVELFRTRE